MIISYILLLFLFLIILVSSARLVIIGVENLEKVIKISYFAIGVIIVGVLTSIPELTIGITSAIKKIPTLSLGNLMGGSFILLTLVMGLSAIFFKGLNFERILPLKELILGNIAILTPALLGLDKEISRLDGLFAIIFYIFYIVSLNKHSLKPKSDSITKRKAGIFLKIFAIFKACLLITFGIMLLLIVSGAIVNIAQKVVNKFNIEALLIGLIILSIGTNLPELSIVFKSKKLNEKSTALGVIIGSAAANSFIIALVAIIYPIKILNFSLFLSSFYFLIFATIIFSIFARTKNRITPSEGILLVMLYIVFLISQIFLSTTK